MGDATLTNSDFTESDEPFRLFGQWLDDATSGEPNDPNGVALATVDPDGMPNVRMVLLKGFDERGFVFYTNFESAKGREILASRKAAMCFHWKSLRRQVRVRGPVEIVSRRGSRRILRDAAARQPHRRLGFQAVAGRWKAASRWRRRSPNTPPNSRSAPSRDRATGPASASCPRPSSSGTTGRSGCTTGSSSRAAKTVTGRRRGFIRELSPICPAA